MFINETIYKDNLDEDSVCDPIKLSPIRIPPYNEEDDDIEAQLVIKIKKNDIHTINKLFLNFLLYILSFLSCIILEIKKHSPKCTVKYQS
jgi:hypothetical protein